MPLEDRESALLSQFCERRFDPREHRGLSKLRKNTLGIGQMLNRESIFSLCLVKQAEGHFRAAYMMPRRMEMPILQGDCQEGTNAR